MPMTDPNRPHRPLTEAESARLTRSGLSVVCPHFTPDLVHLSNELER